MTFRKASLALTLVLATVTTKAIPETEAKGEPTLTKPYRTFVTIKKYNLENNGIPSKPVSNVRLEISFPGGHKLELPEGGHYWSIGNNQSQDINRTFEVPYDFIQKDGFSFDVTMVRKGKKILPCHFEVAHLSQFNRSYVCRTDVAFQMNQQSIPEEKVAKEAIEVRVFSDINSTPAEIPKDAIALK
jgi:hypothetical protein